MLFRSVCVCVCVWLCVVVCVHSPCGTHLHERLSQVGPLLDELAVLLEEGAQEQAQVLDEVLLVVLAVRVRHPDVGVQWKHLPTGGEEMVYEKLNSVGSVVLRTASSLINRHPSHPNFTTKAMKCFL